MSYIPIFPLNAVLFPGGRLPLRVFETRYVDMTRERMKAEQPFGVCLIRKGQEVGKAAVPEDVGCLAHIKDWDMQEQGVLQLRTLGSTRFRILEARVSAQGLVEARIEDIPEATEIPVPENLQSCAHLLRLISADEQKVAFEQPYRFEDPAWVGYRLCEVLPVPLAAKQKLLELTDPISRLEILHRFLEQRGLVST